MEKWQSNTGHEDSKKQFNTPKKNTKTLELLDSDLFVPREQHNRYLVIFFVLLSLYQYFILPFLLPKTGILLILNLLPLMLVNNSFWSLIHEGIHSKLSMNRRGNDMMSRLLAICFGSPFRAIQQAHLLHHKFNRTAMERHEEYDPVLLSPRIARLAYYFRLFIGVYIQELFFPLIALLSRKIIKTKLMNHFPANSYQQIAIERFLKKKNNLPETRIDLLFIFSMFFLSFYCYGSYWPVLIILMMARAFFISVSDYSYHYGSKTDDIYFAFNFKLPTCLAIFILNFNYHGTHHRFPRLPWHALPIVFASEERDFEYNFFHGLARQLRGPRPVSVI
ncbi:fatty acid desaturase family protein [Legionella worsleiensis]|nr:fatty acid desaturase [Legionella worsleiensis]